MDSSTKKNWFALYTKPKHEFKAEIKLNAEGIETYLPKISKIKQWSDRKKKIIEPVLRGYIFIYANEKERLLSLEVDSVIRCISERGKPAIIPEFQIQNLKKFINDKEEYFVMNGIAKGTKVKIKNGPFAGITGIIIEEPTHKSLAVSIDILNRTVIAHISKDHEIELISERKIYEH